MWLFTRKGFVSIVAQREDPAGDLLVRARLAGHIEALFPEIKVEETPLADYRFRALVDRDDVFTAVVDELAGLDYPNFKNSLDPLESDYQRFASRVWAEGMIAQDQAYATTTVPRCGYCDDVLGPISGNVKNRSGERFCSKSHRDAAGREARRLAARE